MDSRDIRRERAQSHGRYAYSFADGTEAEMVYAERSPGVVTITHTYTPPQHRGRGHAAQLVARAVEDFRAAGQKVVPACWFARRQFDERPEWADLLAQKEGERG
jgi:predicted GNAT family acetyltransferase